MALAEVKITPVDGAHSRVTIDGQPVRGVRTIRFEHIADDVPRLTLEMYGYVTVESSADVNRLQICPCCKEEIEGPGYPLL